MKDTDEKISALYQAMFARLSPEERALMGCSMHDFSKEIVLSQIRSPEKTPEDVMGELFTRFYGEDFEAPIMAGALAAIRRYHSDEPR